ncbi:pigment defective 338, chlorplastic [Drosera capensis]
MLLNPPTRNIFYSPPLNTLNSSSFFHLFSQSFSIPFKKSSNSKNTHITYCSQNNNSQEISSTQLPQRPQSETQELGLLTKPSPKPPNITTDESDTLGSEDEAQPQALDEADALAPFLKFFKPRGEGEAEKRKDGIGVGKLEKKGSENGKVLVEYYEPKAGDFVVGVVVYGNENKLDVNVGADMLGTMLKKEVLPFYEKDMDYLLCDVNEGADDFMRDGRIGILKSEEAMGGQVVAGRPIVEAGTVLFAEVLGRTLSGRPLLSARRYFSLLAWHRVRQIQQFNQQIEVRITEWNAKGLLTRIEGVRAFLPKGELVGRANSFTELKQNVGRKMYVLITRVEEAKNDLILSERQAWEKVHLQEGALLEGTVTKIYPYGAQVKIGNSNRAGLLHKWNITRGEFTSVSDLLALNEKVKVLVIKQTHHDKIALSIAELESEPGLFISNKARVFAEAEEIARKYREKLPTNLSTNNRAPPSTSSLSFDDEAILFANWRWFKFQRDTAD